MSYATPAPDEVPSAAGVAAKQTRLILSCFFGSAIEWYDFSLYGLLAPSVFDRLFFPKLDPTVGTIAVLGIFAVGFVGRPLGGLIFGHFGDRLGRKPMMVVTLSLMGISSTLMGLVPTYVTIGVWAPVILVLLRFVQGVALGGESTGAPVLTTESVQSGRRGFFSALIQSGAFAASILATAAAEAVARLPEADMLSWGWRLPFIASIVIVTIGLYIRAKVDESPAFKAAIAKANPARLPLLEVLRQAKGPTLIVFCCALAESSVYFLTAIFGLSYGLRTLHLSRVTMLDGLLLGHILGLVMAPLMGALSDRIGRRPVMGLGFIISALYVGLVFFPLLGTGNTIAVFLAMTFVSAIINPMILCVEGSFYAELFEDARLRYSGVSLGRQFGVVFGGGLIPVVSASLMKATGGNIMSVIGYFVALCIISLVAVIVAPETKDRKI